MPGAQTDDGLKREGKSAGGNGHPDLPALLHERLRFEGMLSRLSTTFINLSATEVDGHIERGLQLLVEYLDIDRSSLAQLSDDGRELRVTHSYTRPGVPRFPDMNIAPLLPWYTGKIRNGELLRYTRLPDELPPEAVHEREAYRLHDLPRSHLVVPFKVGHSVLGGIGFGSFGKLYDWPDELVQGLRLAGEIFANALARKRSEEKETRLREQLALAGRVSLLGELAASIAHEVNQPLCAIVSNAQSVQHMLGGGAYDLGEVREALADISRDGQRASAVIARIRGLLNKAPAERAALDLNDLIREVVALARWEMKRRGVRIKLELADRLLPVLGDRVQLQQVILNLMTNGADAMERIAPEGRELVIRSAADGAGKVLASVQDCGVGIAPHNRDRLFDSFFTTKPGSMGMGLAICKSIMESHGGEIWTSPGTEVGSTFHLSLSGIREGAS